MRKYLFLILMVTFGLSPNLYAAPALPSFIEIVQPDGSALTARQQGDEFQHWTETKSGHTILRNPKTKYWDYAEQDTNGKLKASGYRAMEGLAPPHIPRGLKPPRNKALEQYKRESLNKVYQERLQRSSALYPSLSPLVSSSKIQRAPSGDPGDWTPRPVAGERKLLLVRVNFNNHPLTTNSFNLHSTVFSLSPTHKSVARYYAENSSAAFALSPAEHDQPGSPPGIVTVSIAKAHPGADETFTTERAIIALALEQAKNFVQFSDFDINHDNTIDPSELNIYFIYAGFEASGSDKIPSVWAHAWGGNGGVTAGGLYFTDWAISGELNNDNRPQGMGIIAHELGHTLCGLPDLYDISGKNAGMGIFSLMAHGSWGAAINEDKGTTPTNLDLWSREYLGWATPAEPGNVSSLTIASSLATPEYTPGSGYKLQAAVGDSEYYLLENRHPSGWDLGIQYGLGSGWQGGLLLTHIDLSAGTVGNNDINDSTATGGRQGVFPVQANKERGDMALDPRYWGNRETLFYAGNKTAWTPFTIPDSNYYDGTPTHFSLTAISLPGTTMTAEWSTIPGPVQPVIDDFESGDLTKLPWLGDWTVTTSGYNSIHAAQAPPLHDGELATLETTVVTGDGNLSFRYKVDSEIGDQLSFAIDGDVQKFWSGAVNWSQIFYPLAAGEHRLTWTYRKDLSAAGGQDSAWIDDLSYPPGYNLNISVVGDGGVTADTGDLAAGSATYNDGTVVTLTASPNPNSIFSGWSGACSGNAPCVVTMSTTRAVTATFTPSPAPSVATSPASAINSSGATLNAIVNANNAETTIRFEYGATTSYGTTITALPATAIGTDDTAISATLSELAAGATYHFRVVATNSGGTTYGADAVFLVPMDQAISTISFLPASLTVNGSSTVTATSSSGLPVTWMSTTPAVCTVSGSTVSGITAGICTIAANQAGNTTYSPAPQATKDIPVGKAEQSISAIHFQQPTLALNGSTLVSATATSGLTVTLTSTTPATCTISGSTITGISAGTCTVVASQEGNSNYNTAAPVAQEIAVAKVYVYDGYETTPTDALFALQMAVGKRAIDPRADIAPLINGVPAPDGKVTVADALVILRKAVGLW